MAGRTNAESAQFVADTLHNQQELAEDFEQVLCHNYGLAFTPSSRLYRSNELISMAQACATIAVQKLRTADEDGPVLGATVSEYTAAKRALFKAAAEYIDWEKMADLDPDYIDTVGLILLKLAQGLPG